MEVTKDEVHEIACLCLSLTACDVAEIYTPPRFTPKCSGMGLRPGFVVDLTTKKADGEHWDLSRQRDEEELARLQEKERPKFVVGSPPCTDFCKLLHLNPHTRDTIAERQEQGGKPHMRVAARAYWRQLENGDHFLHENPPNDSWEMPEMKALADDPRVYVVKGPMCNWSMMLEDDNGIKGYVRKETKWMTSSKELAEILEGICSNFTGTQPWHRHVHLVGNNRAQLAAVYPPMLVTAILKAIKRQLAADGRDVNSFAAGPSPDQPEPQHTSSDDEDEDDEEYEEELDPEDPMVKAAEAEEMAWIAKRQVYEKVPLAECTAKQGRPHDMKWVRTRKGDGVRARLVVREIKARKRLCDKLDPATVFAAMPPQEGLKVLISHMQTQQVDEDGADLELGVWDVSRAHFYGKSKREVFTTLPPGYEEPGFCARLLRTMYGTEDAASIWHDTWAEHVEKNGYTCGSACPALFQGKGSRGLCHGDDFAVVASRANLLKFEAMLKEAFDIKRIGILGFGADCDEELSVLKRTLRINRDGGWIELEAHEKHVKKIMKDLKLAGCKTAPTPRVKPTEEEVLAIAASEPLGRNETTLYRSVTMIGAYLATDRPDISEAVKCLAQGMSTPREGRMPVLKRLGRYLAGNPRRVQIFRRQDARTARIRSVVDSDWAGDIGTRKSTSGMCIFYGEHLLKHSSTMQEAISLSSGEAEYYALVRGACHGLGTQAYFADLGIKAEVDCYSDSSAARAFSKRKGLGRMRHVQTRFLWMQDRVKMGHLRVLCVGTKENVADMLTKALTAAEIEQFSLMMNCVRKGDEGKATRNGEA